MYAEYLAVDIISPDPQDSPGSWLPIDPLLTHYTDEETEAQQRRHLPEVELSCSVLALQLRYCRRQW